MNFILKGLTQFDSFPATKDLSIDQYSFDLRPRSFNFVQIEKVLTMIKTNTQVKQFSLLFHNENTMVVEELLKKVLEVSASDQKIFLEFLGETSLEELEKFGHDYIWHYHEDEKIKNIEMTKCLKRIVFTQEKLDEFNRKGELHGFFNLFTAYTEKVFFEIQMDWDAEILLSLFDFFEIPLLSFEINQKVELSYQCPDHLQIQKNLEQIQKLFI